MAKATQPTQDTDEPKKPKLAPLTDDEQTEMADLERRARLGRAQLQPTPHEMMRLATLRERAKANR